MCSAELADLLIGSAVIATIVALLYREVVRAHEGSSSPRQQAVRRCLSCTVIVSLDNSMGRRLTEACITMMQAFEERARAARGRQAHGCTRRKSSAPSLPTLIEEAQDDKSTGEEEELLFLPRPGTLSPISVNVLANHNPCTTQRDKCHEIYGVNFQRDLMSEVEICDKGWLRQRLASSQRQRRCGKHRSLSLGSHDMPCTMTIDS